MTHLSDYILSSFLIDNAGFICRRCSFSTPHK